MKGLVAIPVMAVALTLTACWPTNGTPAQKEDATIEVVVNAWPQATAAQITTAVSIAIAESSLNPTARNPHPEYPPRPDGSVQVDRGLWQISSYWYPQVTDAQCDDPVEAAKVMRLIAHDGATWNEWDTYDNGEAQKHYTADYNGWPAVRPRVDAWLATH